MLYLHLKKSSGYRYSSAGKFISKPGSVHPRRTLDTCVFLLGNEGSYPIRVENREYVLVKDSFMLLPAGYEHAGTGECSAGQSHYWCHFTPLDGYISSAPDAAGDEYVIPEFGAISMSEKHRILFRQLIDCAKDPFLPEMARASESDAYLTVLITEVAVVLAQETGDTRAGESRAAFIKYVSAWIRANAAQISAADVAAEFPYNRDYLTRIFREATGCTIASYINRCRIDNVKKLLLDSTLSVREIAFASGFNDEKRMMKLFRHFEEVTPTEYRQTFGGVYLNTE